MITLKEVAAKCGCSMAAVSKALNGRPDINPQTARRIRAVAKQMGYTPNAAARTLKTNRSKTIGLFFLLEGISLWSHDHFSGIAAAIQRTAEKSGYDVIPVNCDSNNVREGYLDYCRHRNYDGIVVMSVSAEENNLLELIESDIPLITIDSAFAHRDAVISDNHGGMRALMEYVCGRGHRRIAYIHGELTEVTHNRVTSFSSVCAKLSLNIPEEYIQQASYRNPESAAMAAAKLLDLPHPPSCILCPDDYAALGVINEVRARGLRVPEDISIAGYDGIPLTDVIRPRLTTLHQDIDGIGKLAAEMLLDSIRHKAKDRPHRHVLLPGRLVPGESVLNLSQSPSLRKSSC